jgi:hypothetical protein
VRLDPVVGHRQQADARLPAFAQESRDLGQGLARAQQLGAQDVRGEIPVAKGEPGWPRAIGGQLIADGEGLVGSPPALFGVDAAAQGVHHGVQVWADAQAEQRDVVARVADHGDLRVGCGGLEAPQESRGAYAAREHGYPHGF